MARRRIDRHGPFVANGTMLTRRDFGRIAAGGASFLASSGRRTAFAQDAGAGTFAADCRTGVPFALDDVSALFPAVRGADEQRFYVFAFYYPSWHKVPDLSARLGRSATWTEWAVLDDAKPVTPCEIEPKHPLWGSYDNSLPANVEREIGAAADANIDAFMFDWYYNAGDMFYHEPLVDGFLKAGNRDRMNFALMWTNADIPRVWKFDYSQYDFDKMCSHFLEHYAGLSNYAAVHGKPVFGVFNVRALDDALGAATLRRRLDAMRERARSAGFGDLYIVAFEAYRPTDDLAALGFDAASRYHAFYGGAPGTSTFRDAAFRTIETWRQAARTQHVPVFPDCPVGWDDSPRRGAKAHVVLGRSADQYEALLAAAKRFAAEKALDPPLVFLSSWNEWTEDHYLLPDQAYGASYLDAVRHAFPRRQ